MHKKFGKDRTCGSGDILADRQTDTRTSSLQYFTIAPAGKVNDNSLKQKLKISSMSLLSVINARNTTNTNTE